MRKNRRLCLAIRWVAVLSVGMALLIDTAIGVKLAKRTWWILQAPFDGMPAYAAPVSLQRVAQQVDEKVQQAEAPQTKEKTQQAEAEAQPVGGEAPQTEEKTEETYRYDAKGRRDPFESLVEEKPLLAEAEAVIASTRPRGPLERFDLSALQLRGIFWGELGRRAIIRAPDGKGYFVSVGTYMGQKGGQIVAIENDRLVIEEKYRDSKGNIVDKTLTLPLRRKEKTQG